MLMDSLNNAAKKYIQVPLPYTYAKLVRIFSVAVTLFACVSVVILALLAFTTFGVMNTYGLLLTALTAGIAFLIFAYFWAAYKGAMINSFVNGETTPVHMRDFLNYAVRNAPRYFVIFLVKNFFLALVNLPFLLALIILRIDLLSPPGLILMLAILLASFLVKFAFSFVYIAASLKNLSALEAIKGGLRFVFKNLVTALGAYILYSIVWVSLLIPILNLLTLFTAYPIMYLSMINIYKSRSF